MIADPRFWARVDRSGECWLWLGYTMATGYGQVRRGGVLLMAHRHAYELTYGSIAEGMDVSHVCPARACVRPDHLALARARHGLRREARPTVDRFWPKVDKTPTCWLWTGGVTSAGYGAIRTDDGSTVLAHRFSYELNRGPIPDDLVIDHLCRRRVCVNPTHLEPVTTRENNIRAAIGRWHGEAVPA